MSRVRTRPTRDDTRDKLFEAAARVFEQLGIGGASIEAIAAAAGFTRGAFYSNFKSKDELIIAMLEVHVEQSIGRIRDLLDKHSNLADFIDALKTMDLERSGTFYPWLFTFRPAPSRKFMAVSIVRQKKRSREHRSPITRCSVYLLTTHPRQRTLVLPARNALRRE